MTSDERLRNVLAGLAAEAPIELRRSEQVWARYRRARRRAVVVTATAAATAVGALALVVPSGGSRQGLVTRPSQSATAAATRTPDATSAPSPAGTPTASATGRPTESTWATPAPTYAVPAPGPAGRPWPVDVVAFAVWSHVRAGQSMSVFAYPTAGDNGVDEITFDFGDGTVPTTQKVGYCPEEGGRLAVSALSWAGTHRYAANGVYVVTVTARFGGCGRPPQSATTTTTVRVDDEPVGPPTVAPASIKLSPAELRSAPVPGKVAVSLEVTDPDNYVEVVFIQWGDGTATVLRSAVPARCKDSPSSLDPDWPAYVEHTYPRGGTYQAYAAVRTTTCDGGGGGNSVDDEQELHA